MPLESAKPWENLETKRFYNLSENTHFQQRTNERTLRSLLAGDEQVTRQILNIQPTVHPDQNQAQSAQPASLEGSSQGGAVASHRPSIPSLVTAQLQPTPKARLPGRAPSSRDMSVQGADGISGKGLGRKGMTVSQDKRGNLSPLSPVVLSPCWCHNAPSNDAG